MAEQEHDVAAFEAITPGDMQTIEIEGQTILLVRDNEIVHALGATCPPFPQSTNRSGFFRHRWTFSGTDACTHT